MDVWYRFVERQSIVKLAGLSTPPFQESGKTSRRVFREVFWWQRKLRAWVPAYCGLRAVFCSVSPRHSRLAQDVSINRMNVVNQGMRQRRGAIWCPWWILAEWTEKSIGRCWGPWRSYWSALAGIFRHHHDETDLCASRFSASRHIW